MLESAAIYAILLLIAIIVQAVEPGTLCIISNMKVPIIGIVFTLLTIRLHIVAAKSREAGTTLFTLSPRINNSSTSSPNAEVSQSLSGVHVMTTVEVKSSGASQK
jgi:hypothetical protein